MKQVKGLRWWIIGLIALVTIINYIDRNALAIMWPSISKDLGLSKDDYKWIVIVFMLAYAVSQSISGKIYDKIGTRLGFVFSIVIWSLSSGLHGLSNSLMSFSALRVTLGFGEAGNWPGATKSNAEWHPVKERALAQGIFNAGASIGGIISPLLIAFLYTNFGWRTTFPVIATFSLIWLIPWLIVNKGLPKTHPWLSDEERNYITSGQANTANAKPERILKWRELLSYKQSYSVIVSRFFLDPIWWMFVSWLPIYLFEKFNFDIKQIGYFAWVPFVGAAIGSLGGGWASGYLMKKGWTVNKARKTVILVGNLICLPALVLTAYASTPLTAVLLIAVILFGFQVSINNIQTLPSDFLTGKSVGSLAGLGGMSAAFGVVISMLLVPELTKVSWAPFFIMGALLVPVGLASVYFFSGNIEKIQLKDE
ncbi:MAG: MFS transporter [Stygiobacter sp. RIFOXYC12_FULL_38_8]|nr:MAG: MFS transporter [Stygiobacter sp. GWC2_38_9]OGU82050.1 MAG: MFS transporter [Stygiobacter sp. RIFOXYA12_FULL_38_9]OGV09198.1 MAG: MFS transporter [Stygiobacter sp. RIFOXYB2_FULL_37_11]OGV10605.1 MAG: MFS transporter [Stygiobacter sp. RIFOXYA2_FULL_38_8]OGV13845.1 MAG: MFS transporter [Stygiobacter sp. RIFOXYC2_FULL_38_25]OGV27444.1 MAG: MFS transporter [Stygiobacter sp. RIFOXYC12_FULL_38_8]OGV80229.1 MAG: MFS transporter [Stygiobacter sp. GWF2_38_21]OGV87483.1 MAG: MFS transporter [M